MYTGTEFELYLLKPNQANMKKIMIISVLAGLSALTACTKLKQLANIDVNIPYSQQISVPTIPGGVSGTPIPGGLTVPFPAVGFATNSKQYIAQYHTSANKIISVGLNSLALQILSPSGQNFDFLDNVDVYISSQTQPEMLLASDIDIPKGQTTLNLVTATDVNLKNYFIDDTIYFRMTAHINAVPFSGTQLEMSSIFNLLANPLD